MPAISKTPALKPQIRDALAAGGVSMHFELKEPATAALDESIGDHVKRLVSQ